jgi:hypothetical protein
MGTAVIVIIVVAVLVVLVLVALLAARMRKQAARREALRARYGPEYDRAVQQAGSRRRAEEELEERAQQREQLQLRALDPEARRHYQAVWIQTQAEFVDSPVEAVDKADSLLTSVMRDRGYPTEGFEQQARLLSVDHSRTIDEYRQGHEIAGLARRGEATTEQLRRAMVHYRTLFTELVEHEEPYPQRGDGTGAGGGTAPNSPPAAEQSAAEGQQAKGPGRVRRVIRPD